MKRLPSNEKNDSVSLSQLALPAGAEADWKTTIEELHTAEEEISELRLQKEGQNEHLQRDGSSWRILEPFQAAALPHQVDKILKALAAPSCVRFETHVAKELKNYGLDKPYLRVAVTELSGRSKSGADEKEPEKKDATKTKEKPKEHVLLIGQPTAAGAATRFAKLGDGEAVFVVDQNLAGPLDQTALDLLDRTRR